MTEEEYIIDIQYEIFSKAMEIEADKYYRTPWSIKQDILSIMSDSDIAMIIWEKRKEWWLLEWEKKAAMKWLRGDDRKLVELLFLDDQEKINKLTNEMQYALKSRSANPWKGYTAEDLQRAKDSISIIDVIEITAWVKIHSAFRLIKCPFPAHRDKTPSMKIYKNTNSFFCQWCHKGWSQVDFIMNMSQCDLATAIVQFIQFYKK